MRRALRVVVEENERLKWRKREAAAVIYYEARLILLCSNVSKRMVTSRRQHNVTWIYARSIPPTRCLSTFETGHSFPSSHAKSGAG